MTGGEVGLRKVIGFSTKAPRRPSGLLRVVRPVFFKCFSAPTPAACASLGQRSHWGRNLPIAVTPKLPLLTYVGVILVVLYSLCP